MSRHIPLAVLAALVVAVTGPGVVSAFAADGKAVFESLHCASCHKPDQKATGASLADIAKAYQDSEKLVQYFKGEGKSLIETDKPGMMRGQMPKLQALPDEDKKALADYILSTR